MYPVKNHAQYHYTFYEQGNYTGYAYQNIHLVSNWVKYPDRYSVSVVPYDLSQRIRLTRHDVFFYGPASNTTITNIDSIPEGMTIKDIETIDNYAIFCGTIRTEDRIEGFIGYFDINPIAFTGSPYTTLYWRKIKVVTSINELVVNSVGGHIHVIAIGEWRENNSSTFYVIENTDLTNTSPSLSFNEKPLYGFETAYEIKSTENWVAVIGSERMHDALYMRRCSWSNGINDPAFDTIHYVVASTGECLSKTHSINMVDDKIAVSYLSGVNNVFSIKIRVIDIATVSNYYAQEIPFDTKVEPKELTYLSAYDQLVMLVDMNYPSSSVMQSLFIDIKPYTTIPYAADVFYFDGPVFYTLDCIENPSKSYMALADRDRYAIRYDAAPWPAGDYSCPYKTSINATPIYNIKFYNVVSPIPYGTNSYNLQSLISNANALNSSTICVNH